MDFTREPIIETIITPRDGYKLVIRSSKSAGQEEYFVDAIEIVAFGHALFFRSLERPKAFLVPVSDYEILEVREARMVLKNAVLDRSIKIGGGREGALKASREAEKEEAVAEEGEGEQEEVQPAEAAPAAAEARPEIRVDKKRDRRRHYRKRKGREEREEAAKEEAPAPAAAEPIPPLEDGKINIPPPEQGAETIQEGAPPLASSLLSSLLQPPPTLISETIKRYRQDELFKNAFYLTEEEQYKPHDKVQELLNEDDEELPPSLRDPTFVPEEEQQPSELAEQAPEEQQPSESAEQAPIEESVPVKSEEEQEEKPVEEAQLLLPVKEELLLEVQEEIERSSLPFEKEEENEPEAGLPLYLEEDVSMTSEQEYHFPEEEENPLKENHHTPHNNGQPT